MFWIGNFPGRRIVNCIVSMLVVSPPVVSHEPHEPPRPRAVDSVRTRVQTARGDAKVSPLRISPLRIAREMYAKGQRYRASCAVRCVTRLFVRLIPFDQT
jgi:hypothetical protein